MRAVQSMTGSGSATGSCELGRVTIELRSVNGRGLTTRFRVAAECLGLEPSIERAIRGRLVRGSVTVAADVVESVRSARQSIDDIAFESATTHLRDLARQHGLGDPTLREVLLVPGVLSSPSAERSRVSWEPSTELASLIEQALDRLVARREAEGTNTVQVMLGHLAALAGDLEEVRARAPQLAQVHRANLLSRVNEFLERQANQLEDVDIVREVALFADRIDISEEIHRLDSHVDRLRAELAGAGPVGRDVEFLLQEMLREVNTLGSKSPDVEVAHHVVAMKSSIDKLKEQAANLE